MGLTEFYFSTNLLLPINSRFLEHDGAQEPLQSGNVKNQQGNQDLSPRKRLFTCAGTEP